MIIPIEFDAPSASNPKLPASIARVSHDEVVLIELQGTLDVESTYEGEHDGKFVGKLTVDDELKRSTLRIGHHHLDGKIVALPKPLAVIHKTQSSGGNDASDNDDDDLGTKWQAVAIVKRKIMFSTRPMPIVGKLS